MPAFFFRSVLLFVLLYGSVLRGQDKIWTKSEEILCRIIGQDSLHFYYVMAGDRDTKVIRKKEVMTVANSETVPFSDTIASYHKKHRAKQELFSFDIKAGAAIPRYEFRDKIPTTNKNPGSALGGPFTQVMANVMFHRFFGFSFTYINQKNPVDKEALTRGATLVDAGLWQMSGFLAGFVLQANPKKIKRLWLVERVWIGYPRFVSPAVTYKWTNPGTQVSASAELPSYDTRSLATMIEVQLRYYVLKNVALNLSTSIWGSKVVLVNIPSANGSLEPYVQKVYTLNIGAGLTYTFLSRLIK